ALDALGMGHVAGGGACVGVVVLWGNGFNHAADCRFRARPAPTGPAPGPPCRLRPPAAGPAPGRPRPAPAAGGHGRWAARRAAWRVSRRPARTPAAGAGSAAWPPAAPPA